MLKECRYSLWINFLTLSAFLIPFNFKWLGWLGSATFILTISSGKIRLPCRKSHLVLLLLGFSWLCWLFILYLGILNDTSGCIKTLETRAGFWLGLVLIIASNINKMEAIRILKAFHVGLIISLIICLLVALYRSLLLWNVKWMVHSDFSLFMHPGYYSVMTFFALYSEVFVKNKTNRLKILFYSVCIILLSNKAIWLSLIFSLFLLWFYSPKIRGKVNSFLSRNLLLFSIVSIISLVLNYQRVTEAFQELRGQWPEKNYRSSVLVRQQTLNAGLHLFPEAVPWGLGENNLRAQLSNYYQQKGYTIPFKNNYNIHNQFVEEFLLHGIPGVIFLVSIAIIFIIMLGSSSRTLVLAFVFIFIIWGNTESFLQRNMGCLFLGFLLPLLTRVYEKECEMER